MKKKTISIIAITIIFIGIVTIFAFLYHKRVRFSSRLIHFTRNVCVYSQECVVDLKTITNFNWDTVYYIPEGNLLDHTYAELIQYIPASINEFEYTRLKLLEHDLVDHMIVFEKNENVVYSERLPAGIENRNNNEIFFDYLTLNGIGKYSSTDAVFRIERIPTHNGGYFGKNSYFINLVKR